MKPEELIHRYLIGEATAEEVEELDRLLAGDAELRRLFVREAGNDTALRQIALQRQSGEMDPKKDVAPTVRPLAWVALLAGVAMLAAFLWSQSSPSRQPEIIAELVSSEDAAWESSLPTEPGSELGSGSMKLTSGIATIRFRSGAEMTLEAPANLSIKTPMLAELSLGAAVVRVPESAIGFVLETPGGRVVDYGTAFAVDVVGGGKPSNVEVIEGEVAVVIPETGEEVRLVDHQGAFLGDRKIATYEGPLPEEEIDPSKRVRRIGTMGRSFSVVRGNKEKWLRREMLLVRRRKESSNHERRSFFSFDLSGVNLENVESAQVRLNQVPSGLGYASRLPPLSEIAVYGLTNPEKSNWEPGVRWDDAPSPEDGVLLGTMQIPRSQQRASRVFSSEGLMGFLKEHAGGQVTLILDREPDPDTGAVKSLVLAFASDLHPEAAGPKLELLLKD